VGSTCTTWVSSATPHSVSKARRTKRAMPLRRVHVARRGVGVRRRSDVPRRPLRLGRHSRLAIRDRRVASARRCSLIAASRSRPRRRERRHSTGASMPAKQRSTGHTPLPECLVARVRGEYVEMPGLRVTPAQGCRHGKWTWPHADSCSTTLSAMASSAGRTADSTSLRKTASHAAREVRCPPPATPRAAGVCCQPFATGEIAPLNQSRTISRFKTLPLDR
jgi:hypothetical protein